MLSNSRQVANHKKKIWESYHNQKFKKKQTDHSEQNKQNLSTLLKNTDYSGAPETLAVFVERSLTTETRKALAIHIFIHAYNIGMGILPAASVCAKVTGMSSKTVRNWTTEFLEINQLCPIDTEIINDVMFSARGNHAKTISLFTSVEF